MQNLALPSLSSSILAHSLREPFREPERASVKGAQSPILQAQVHPVFQLQELRLATGNGSAAFGVLQGRVGSGPVRPASWLWPEQDELLC